LVTVTKHELNLYFWGKISSSFLYVRYIGTNHWFLSQFYFWRVERGQGANRLCLEDKHRHVPFTIVINRLGKDLPQTNGLENLMGKNISKPSH
jgi:hypothetical protein